MEDSVRRYQCPHCDIRLKEQTYRRHQKLYFDISTKTWMRNSYLDKIQGKESPVDAQTAEPKSKQPRTELLGTVSRQEEPLLQGTGSLLHNKERLTQGTETFLDDKESEDPSSLREQSSTILFNEMIENGSDSEWEQDEAEQMLDSYGLPEETTLLEDDRSPMFIVLLLSWASKYSITERAFSLILGIFHLFMSMSGLTFFSKYHIPKTLYLSRKAVGLLNDDFTKYVTCPKCTSIYNLRELMTDGKITQFVCHYTRFTTGKYAQPCNTVLFKKLKLKESIHHIPLKTYVYGSLINNIEDILLRDNMWKNCQQWRSRKIPTNHLSDIYDGQIWKNFGRQGIANNGNYFFDRPNLGLMLNLDWFQPFKRRSDISVGVLYVVILNLPRDIRFKKENCIVLSIIPNLSKEPADLRHFLQPFVEELQLLWTGVKLRTNEHSQGIYIRAALLAVACDTPAARKVGGFMGCNGKMGCLKCKKVFSGSVGCMNYGGFDSLQWEKRTVKEHRKYAHAVKKCSSFTKAKDTESKYGYRYTPLLDLEYFDPEKMVIIDPMHLLFLGLGKHMWKHYYITLKLFNAKEIAVINERIDAIGQASDGSWTPKEISANYGCWTAQEWLGWLAGGYALYALQGILENDHMKLLQTLVLACHKLVKPMVTRDEVIVSHSLLLKFCKGCEELYGSDFIVPNMHLALHLKDCVFDFGSVYGFWLFPFERYNFNMGTINTNGHFDIEVQMLRQVQRENKLIKLQNEQIGVDIQKQLPSLFSNAQPAIVYHDCLHVPNAKASDCTQCWNMIGHLTFPKKFRQKHLTRDDRILLHACYKSMYPNLDVDVENLPLSIKCYSDVYDNKSHWTSTSYGKGKCHGQIIASWSSDNGAIDFDGCFRPGRTLFYFIHNLPENTGQDSSKYVPHVFAAVKWYLPYPAGSDFLPPLSTWLIKKFVQPGPSCFLPIQRIAQKYGCAARPGDRLIVAPQPPKACM